MERQRAMETIHTGIWHNKPPESKEAAKNLLSLALEDKLTYTCVNGGEWDPVDGMWKPSKMPGHIGMGMGRVLDFIGVKYE